MSDSSSVMGWVGMLLICGMIGGCVESCSDGGAPSATAIKYVGRERLKESLKDPGSLEIISEEVTPENGYKATFRAKNSFGGYTVDSVHYR